MESQKIILLPLDGSEASLNALMPAKSIARLLNLPVLILYISDQVLSKEELMQKLKLKKGILPKCLISQKNGNPADIIIEASKNAAYIIMSTHGETLDLSKMAGNVVSKVIQNTNVPIILIRPNANITEENGLWKPKKVLIPLNGTPGASQALDPVSRLLPKNHVQIDLLHITLLKSSSPEKPGYLSVPYYMDSPHYEWPNWAREFLKRFCLCPTCSCNAGQNNIKFNIFVSKGDPCEEIISFALKNNNDLIAIAWHGILEGEHAKILKKVIFESPCPVMLTKIV